MPDASEFAALYAAVHRGNPGDVDFYRRVCADAASVLELGAGSGRIAHALAADGPFVMGLERDRALVELARDRGGADVRAGDMRDFALGRTFDRVIVPYNGIYCLLSEEDLLRCLRCVRDHLAEGGLLVFDGYAADAFHHAGDAPGEWDELAPVARAEALGRRFEVLEQSRWEPATQRLEARYVHVPDDGGESIEMRIQQRYLLSSQVGPLLSRAGLETVALLGGFDQSAFDPEESELLVVVAGLAPP